MSTAEFQDNYEGRLAARKQDCIEEYGPELGEAFHNYREGTFRAEDSVHIEAFAEVITNALESNTHEERTKAIKALIDSFHRRDWDLRAMLAR